MASPVNSATFQTQLCDLLARLVRIETVNPPGLDYDEMTRLLLAELKGAGIKARRFTVPQALLREALPRDQWGYPRYNVLGRWDVGARKTLHFNAHFDVVPVSGIWRHGSPFSGEVERGWQYGRGTADMKGSIASLLIAFRMLRASKLQPRLNVEVSFTADEETDSALGANWLVHHAPIDPDYAVVMEGGEGDAICCGHNGVVWLNVTVHGKAAHGSMPERGVNALEKMSALVLALEEYKKQLARRGFSTPDGQMMHSTINVGGVFTQGAGAKINTVPNSATFSIDRRVLAIESVSSAEKELRAFLREAAARVGAVISVEKVSDNHPCFSAPEGPFFNAMARVVQEVRKRKPVFNVSTGFNDMHFFSHHLRIPTLGYGPIGVDYHAVDERAPVKDLLRTADVYARLMLGFDGG